MRIYFDTCVLSSYLKGELDSFLEYFSKDDPTLIVSDIHLKELNNAKEYGLIDGFYNLLKKIPFEYISISNDGIPEFSKPPVSELKNIANSDNSFSIIEEKFSLLFQRFFDKKPTVSFSSLFSNLKIDPKVFSEPNDDLFTKVLIQAAFNPAYELLDEAQQEIEKVNLLTKNDFSFNQEFLDCLPKIGEDHLTEIGKIIGNIKPPDALQQIFRIYEPQINECLKKNNHPPINLSVFLESVMGHDRFNNIYAIIFLLNFLSYRRDKRMNKFDKFQGSQNDAMHLIYASYCSSFITIDCRLYKKAVATYEFLKITTRLEHLKMKGKMIELKTAYQFSNSSP